MLSTSLYIHFPIQTNSGGKRKIIRRYQKNSFGVWCETIIKSNCVCTPDNVYENHTQHYLWKANTKWFMKSTHKMIYEKQTQSKSNIFVSALCNQHLLKFHIAPKRELVLTRIIIMTEMVQCTVLYWWWSKQNTFLFPNKSLSTFWHQCCTFLANKDWIITK